ncbi:extracellular solute-binding protein [Amphibacillus sp. MSJ-3]|uniref:ABC transporter substrate-binding protein n=1 Tax=Amphibacillus sp. MSJ-3 TaxID=2841505 RepID=UPI001C0EBC1C|nr:extracellular solute-binding protein [Amphibacillus sp. MSJ-3]MBU5594304.1 extracellular solute-binding protein [Amphibacillus sp. MSJ-3]
MTSMKKVFIACMTLSIVFLLAACGNGDSQADGKTEIEFFNQKKEMQTTLQEIIKDFEEENPDITVKFTNVPDAGTVLKTRISSGDIPDIINIYPQNADFQAWANSDIFTDLTGKDYLNNLTEGAAEAYAINDKVYSVPLTSNAWGFFYNVDKFEELNLEVPKTWDDFEQLIKDIQGKEETPFALSLTQEDAWTLNGYHQLAWATTNGGYEGANNALVFSPKGSIKVGNADFDAVADQLDLLNGTGQKNATGASYEDAIATFANQEALILPNGTWALPAVQNQNPEFEIGMFAYPGQEEGQELTVGAADLALSIAMDSENQEAAEKFVEYMTSKEAMQKYYDVDGSPTSVTSVDTEGKFSETAGVTQYVFTDQQIVWLQKDWTSEETFHHLTVEYVNSQDRDQLATNLNNFFDTMK